jgi:hypothetical protein
MLTIQIEGLDIVRQQLREFSDRRFRAAVATSLTRAAKDIKEEWQQQITNRVDRPVARTKSATVFLSANVENIKSEVRVKDQLSGTPPATYLNPQERAGSRRVKQFEQALQASGAMPRGYVLVPGRGAQLDGYGNVSRSQIISVITQLGTDYSPGYQRVIPKTVAGRLAVMARRGKSYIAVQPGEEAARKVSPGIYERGSGGALRAVFIFKRSVRYRKLLDLERTAAREAPDIIAREFRRAVAESFARMKG